MVGLSPDPAPGLTFWAQVSRPAPNKGPTVGVSLETFARRNGVVWRASPNGGIVARNRLKVYLNETAPQWERLRTRSSPHGVNNSRPSPAGARPGSTPTFKAIRRAHFRLGHAGRQARTVSDCLNSAFLGLFLYQLRSQLWHGSITGHSNS